MLVAEPPAISRVTRRRLLLGGLIAALTPLPARAAAPVVVIDPGHGGRDPGAIGVAGTLEKTVTLAAALELKRQLDATRRYRVRLTRSGDQTVSLPARVAFARAEGAALLISIHADYAPSPATRGPSVFIRAPEAPARRVPTQPREIARALAGDAQGSAWLRRLLIERLDDGPEMSGRPAREADLYVLRASGMASVLLEMGFLSNRRDEAALNQSRHRATLARAIREAVDAYFQRLARPPGRRA